ncbi:DUF664 domain-containing protein [uncultured Corynebacterium sp.]|uniref:mycothiol transferase n=1 Tax=uncultured Corynebacterium sp. TaxID=159447 RepID=UPI0025F28CCC|nr:DUF664 domain-containing protein [uncultured Corynebacterium sp.]
MTTKDPARPLESHILTAFDAIAAIVGGLDDDLANARPDMPGANSPLVLLRHVGGSARYWLDHVCLGNENVRDRTDEFTASGTVADELERHAAQRAVIVAALEALRDADPNAAPAAPPTDKQRWWAETTGALKVHVYNECAQHLGHLEITRDVLLAGLPRAGQKRSVLDLIIDELDRLGHPADAIEPDEYYGGHVITTTDDVQLATVDIEAACIRVSEGVQGPERTQRRRWVVREQLIALLED